MVAEAMVVESLPLGSEAVTVLGSWLLIENKPILPDTSADGLSQNWVEKVPAKAIGAVVNPFLSEEGAPYGTFSIFRAPEPAVHLKLKDVEI